MLKLVLRVPEMLMAQVEASRRTKMYVCLAPVGLKQRNLHHLRDLPPSALPAEPPGFERNPLAARVQGELRGHRGREAKLLPIMGDALRKRRHGTRRRPGVTWYVDETYLKPNFRPVFCVPVNALTGLRFSVSSCLQVVFQAE
jgi:hypothetical protein